MSDKTTGVVEDIVSRQVNGSNGTFTAYDYHIDGTKYGAGSFQAKGVNVGDTVEFVVVHNGNYKNIQKNSLRKIAGGAAPARQEAAPATAPVYTGKTVNQKAEEKDARISKQSAFNTAVAFLSLAQASGALPKLEGKSTGYGFLKELFFKEAAALYEHATGEAWDLQAPPIDGEAGKVPAKPKKAAAAPVVEPEPAVQDDDWNDQINF